jgi:hypothetical protein
MLSVLPLVFYQYDILWQKKTLRVLSPSVIFYIKGTMFFSDKSSVSAS